MRTLVTSGDPLMTPSHTTLQYDQRLGAEAMATRRQAAAIRISPAGAEDPVEAGRSSRTRAGSIESSGRWGKCITVVTSILDGTMIDEICIARHHEITPRWVLAWTPSVSRAAPTAEECPDEFVRPAYCTGGRGGAITSTGAG